MGIFDEPRPIAGVEAPTRSWPALERVIPLTRRILTGSDGFFEVLARRRSALGGSLSERELSSVLWHAMLLRERNHNSRFGEWESRAAPSAGGLHSIGVICLPVDRTPWSGFYDAETHALQTSRAFEDALTMNRQVINDILGARQGVTLQLVGNRPRYEACYENWETLFWRDAGVLVSVFTMTAVALGLAATAVGRTGKKVVTHAGFGSRYVAGGAIHVGSNRK